MSNLDKFSYKPSDIKLNDFTLVPIQARATLSVSHLGPLLPSPSTSSLISDLGLSEVQRSIPFWPWDFHTIRSTDVHALSSIICVKSFQGGRCHLPPHPGTKQGKKTKTLYQRSLPSLIILCFSVCLSSTSLIITWPTCAMHNIFKWPIKTGWNVSGNMVVYMLYRPTMEIWWCTV